MQSRINIVFWLFSGLLSIAASGQQYPSFYPSAGQGNQEEYNSIPIADALTQLEHIYRVSFIYEDTLLYGKRTYQIKNSSNDIYQDLHTVLGSYPIAYSIVGGRTIVLFPEEIERHRQSTGTISGRVTTDRNEGIPSAQVLIDGTQIGTAADNNGDYLIRYVPAGTVSLRTRVIGYRSEHVHVVVPPGSPVVQNFALSEDPLNMEEVVTTASRIPTSKIESSVAITTLTDREIKNSYYQNTADLLSAIPGFYVESSGGEGGNNLFPRGIPQDGSYRYIAMFEDGLPIYEAPELAFANIDLMMRVDETIRVVEGVRGGTGSIFASNAPGGIINFISKTGGSELEGTSKLTTGDFGLLRLDFNYGGPLDRNWRFNIGGFMRHDHGIRSPGFTANRGGQIKANLTRFFSEGYFRVYAKYLNDHNVFYLPIPLQNPDDPTSLAGFDGNYGTLTSLKANPGIFPTPDGRQIRRDIRDGMHPEVKTVTSELFLDLGNQWSLRNTTRLMSADLQFNAIFSLDSPFQAAEFAEIEKGLTPERGFTGWQYRDAHTGEVIDEPASLNENGLVARSGWWAVTKPLQNFINDLQLQQLTEEHTLTAGVYFSQYSAEDFWYWQNILTEVRKAPRLLDLLALDARGNAISVTKNGFEQFGTFYLNANSRAHILAAYFAEEWHTSPRLDFDIGMRIEHANFSGLVENTQSDFAIPNASSLAEIHVTYGDSTFRRFNDELNDWAVSVGGNYNFSSELAVYMRGSRGFRMPDFDHWLTAPLDLDAIEGSNKSQNVLQFESGVKINKSALGLFGTVYFSRLNNIPFIDEIIDRGEIRNMTRFANSEAIGAEIEANWRPLKYLNLHLISTLQDSRLRDLTFKKIAVSQENVARIDLSGNKVRRIPSVLMDFRPELRLGSLRLYGVWRYVGKRYVDDSNTATLPAFSVFNTGALFDVPGMELTVALHVANLTNALGLTESNPRVDQIIADRTDVFMARPIFGRSSVLSLSYKFRN